MTTNLNGVSNNTCNGNNYVKISDIEELCRPNCKIKDYERVEKILNNILVGGASQLQVLSDFDYTITKQRTDKGKPSVSSFGMFNKCKSLPESYLCESNKLFEKYRPLEICPNISHDEKVAHMIEWWRKSSDLLKGFPFNPSDLDELAYKYNSSLRDGTHELFKFTNELNVPLLVFSAGLGDSILAVLKHANLMYDNVTLVSNFLQYDNGILNGLGNEQNVMIHTFNKNEEALKGTAYYDMVHDRHHVLLMGDSLGDDHMSDGVPSSSSVLKIGFLFDHPEKNLPKYLDRFDIVLVDDQSMDIPRKILSLVASHNDNAINNNN